MQVLIQIQIKTIEDMDIEKIVEQATAIMVEADNILAEVEVQVEDIGTEIETGEDIQEDHKGIIITPNLETDQENIIDKNSIDRGIDMGTDINNEMVKLTGIDRETGKAKITDIMTSTEITNTIIPAMGTPIMVTVPTMVIVAGAIMIVGTAPIIETIQTRIIIVDKNDMIDIIKYTL